ncbi:hypothetical protein LENED_007421 [Lentinula edodes]|uniref:Uncharacterized protein n=1 Tax=Lentinula edodes TaxID=5353 RepID=A0A1Q3EEC1_LENED|nr:hypothetical protein LENED_007421 [Lentinula edodes]
MPPKSSIARDAQARKCQLYGSSFAVAADVSTTHLNKTIVPSSSESFANSGLGTSIKKREEPKSKRVAEQPAPSKRRKEQKEETQSPDPEAKPKAKGAPKPIKGASLANPTKKARKYQATLDVVLFIVQKKTTWIGCTSCQTYCTPVDICYVLDYICCGSLSYAKVG